MSKNDARNRNIQKRLNSATPGAHDAKLGDMLQQIITNQNALLQKLDAANLAGMGTNNYATLGILPLDQRG